MIELGSRARIFFTAIGLGASVCSSASEPSRPVDRAAPAVSAETVSIVLSYTGPGKVSAQHRLLVFLFDHPGIDAESVPIAMQTMDVKKGTLEFEKLTADPVFVAVVYDETGTYDGLSGPPPRGTPIAYHRFPGTDRSAPIHRGETIWVTIDAKTRFER